MHINSVSNVTRYLCFQTNVELSGYFNDLIKYFMFYDFYNQLVVDLQKFLEKCIVNLNKMKKYYMHREVGHLNILPQE